MRRCIFYGAASPVIKATNAYLDIVGSGYVKLLQMIIMPLIMVSIIAAILKLKDASSLGKISALTIGLLIAKLFGLTATGLTASAAEVAKGEYMQGSLASAQAISVSNMLLSLIPANPSLDLTGVRKTSTIAVVIFFSIHALNVSGSITAGTVTSRVLGSDRHECLQQQLRAQRGWRKASRLKVGQVWPTFSNAGSKPTR